MPDPLPSWNDTPNTRAILEFVAAATDESGPRYRPPVDRLATFDNDGTLWCEQPMAQGIFVMNKLATMAEADSSLRARQPYKAALEHDTAWVGRAMTKHYDGDSADLKALFAAALQASMVTVEEFALDVEEFFRTARHPKYNVSFLETTYLPMVELLDYLRANDFACLMTSGGGRDFLRPIAEQLYSMTSDQVIGSGVEVEFKADDDGAHLVRTGGLDFLDDGPGKPIHIWNRTGRRPIMAAGNANGDIPMLQYATAQQGLTLGMLVHHDDDVRDIAYDAGGEEAFPTAAENGWLVISVKDDWNQVYSFQENSQ